MKVPHALLILLAADQMAIESGVSAFLAPLPCPVKMIKPKFEVVGNVVSRLNCGSRIILKAADADEEPTTVIQIEDLTQSQIVELIEVTFINACMQLAQGYVDILKLFIVAVQAARVRRVPNLVDWIDACPVQTAGRPLAPEEVQLRTTWIHAVNLMLDHIGHDDSTAVTADTPETCHDLSVVRSTYSPILPDLLALKGSGGSLNTPVFVQEHKDVLPASLQEDAVQMAIVSQTIKVLWYTLVVLDEERLANDINNDDQLNVARAQIPRGQGIN